MNEMITWLRACLDDDEKAAKAATKGPWRHNPDKHWRKPGTAEFEESVFAGPAGDAATSVAGTGPSDDPQSMADAAHIARHDPAAVLEDIRMKRDLLDEYEAVAHLDTDQPPTEYAHGRARGLGEAVKTIAAAYRHRPGFKESWGV